MGITNRKTLFSGCFRGFPLYKNRFRGFLEPPASFGNTLFYRDVIHHVSKKYFFRFSSRRKALKEGCAAKKRLRISLIRLQKLNTEIKYTFCNFCLTPDSLILLTSFLWGAKEEYFTPNFLCRLRTKNSLVILRKRSDRMNLLLKILHSAEVFYAILFMCREQTTSFYVEVKQKHFYVLRSPQPKL